MSDYWSYRSPTPEPAPEQPAPAEPTLSEKIYFALLEKIAPFNPEWGYGNRDLWLDMVKQLPQLALEAEEELLYEEETEDNLSGTEEAESEHLPNQNPENLG